jgi:anti-sigma factor RsiW
MSDQSITELIRLDCDGELDQEQARQLQRHLQAHPEDRKLVESERRLRARVGIVMTAACPSAPADLAERIRQGLDTVKVDVEAEPAGYSFAQWLQGPRRANVYAVAASLVLVAGAVLVGIFGPQIDDQLTQAGAGQAVEAASAVAGEHVDAAFDNGRMLDSMTVYDSLTEAEIAMARYLEARLTAFDLRGAGYEFVGAMKCNVPHCERSCHFLYRRQDSMPGLVSLHIVPDHGQFDLSEGQPFEGELPLDSTLFPKNPGCPQDVIMFSDGKLVFLVVMCVSEDAMNVVRAMQGQLLHTDVDAP